MVIATAALPDGEAFIWGVAGGLIALAITQVLPAAAQLMHGAAGPVISRWRVIGAVIVVAIFGAAGGAAAMIMGDAKKPGNAIVYGMAWEAILGGAIKTGRAVLPPG